MLDEVQSFKDKEVLRLTSDNKLYAAADFPYTDIIKQHTPIDKITVETEPILWHQWMGHVSDHYLYTSHKFIDSVLKFKHQDPVLGVLKFKHQDPVLDKCPVCIQLEQLTTPGWGNTMKVTVHICGFSINYTFSCQLSKDLVRQVNYLGIHEKTCWLLIHSHFLCYFFMNVSKPRILLLIIFVISLMLFVLVMVSALIDTSTLDQGGELFKNPKVQKIFENWGFSIYPIGANASHQNGSVERTHYTVTKTIQAFLIGSFLPIKLGLYAFHHTLWTRNTFPS